MNKQAFTFLALFSLILVLSIYYITLPPIDETQVIHSTNTIDQLQNDLNQKREEIIEENNSIIAQESSSAQTINEALETISETKNLTKQESELVNVVKELGYQQVYVEIQEKTVKVTILLKGATKTDASKIIDVVLEHLDSSYQVEVKFINE